MIAFSVSRTHVSRYTFSDVARHIAEETRPNNISDSLRDDEEDDVETVRNVQNIRAVSALSSLDELFPMVSR